MQLQDKVAVVTGGNSGIGRASAEALAAEGAKVIVFGRNRETLEATVAALGEGHHGVQGDVANLGDLDRLFAETKERYGRVDVLVVNAGVADTSPVVGSDEALYNKLFDINVKGAFFTVQKALPLLQAGGSVVLVSSSVQQKGVPGLSLYSATKAAVRSLARSFTAELAGTGVRFNVLSPGPIETPIFDRMGLSEEQKQGMAEGLTQQVPLGRFGKADEMARAVVFLGSDASSYLAGSELVADGGFAAV
jgi:NAD(P)-dependent dehydrogenase (short-subunit alcohol dehydrogenase family)